MDNRFTFRKSLFSIVVISLINPVSTNAFDGNQSHFAPRKDNIQRNEGMCRRAPNLPIYNIPKEIINNQVHDKATVTPLHIPSMPPPMPPPPPSPTVADVAEAVASPTPSAIMTAKAAHEMKGRYGYESANSNVAAGQLTAGDHDDLLNPNLYAKYVDDFLSRESLNGVPRVDSRNILTVSVRDNKGSPIPFANVTLTCVDGNTLTLSTMVDGKAVFFPALDNLGDVVEMVATDAGNYKSNPRRINIKDVAGAQDVRVQLVDAKPIQIKRFDLAIMLDATGSMGDEINYLKAELRSIIDEIKKKHKHLDVKIALVVYRDHGDEFLVRTYDFSSDFKKVQQNLKKQSANGGGDMPEAVEVALSQSMQLNWRNNSVKSLLLVADAPPHSDDVAATWASTEVARHKRIQIVPVAASSTDKAAQYLLRAMAALTQSRYIFITDDSGIGNPHAEPSVDCYKVTKLNNMILRVLDSQITGKRVEPQENEIIRVAGDYDNGKCRISE